MRYKPKRGKILIKRHEGKPVPIVKSTGVSVPGIHEGRLTPIIRLDSSKRPDITELIRVNRELAPIQGDVAIQWIAPEDWKNEVGLLLQFITPFPANLLLSFDILRQGGLVDMILLSRILTIEEGVDDAPFEFRPDYAHLSLEVPDTGFFPAWDELISNRLYRQYRAQGMKKIDAQMARDSMIREWRGTLDKIAKHQSKWS